MARDQAKWFCLVVIVTACCVRSFFVFLWLSYSLCHSLMLQPYKISFCVDGQCMQDTYICTVPHDTYSGFWIAFLSQVLTAILMTAWEQRWIVSWDYVPTKNTDVYLICAYLHAQFALVKCLTVMDQMTEDCLSLDFYKKWPLVFTSLFLNWVTIVMIKLGSTNKVSLVSNGAEKSTDHEFSH